MVICYSSLIQRISTKNKANIILKGERQNVLPLRSGISRNFTLGTSIQLCISDYRKENGQENKMHLDWKGRSKTLLVNDMILHTEIQINL